MNRSSYKKFKPYESVYHCIDLVKAWYSIMAEGDLSTTVYNNAFSLIADDNKISLENKESILLACILYTTVNNGNYSNTRVFLDSSNNSSKQTKVVKMISYILSPPVDTSKIDRHLLIPLECYTSSFPLRNQST